MRLRSALLMAGLMLIAVSGRAACNWPAWEQFRQNYISDQGRVIDPSDERKITTSEGQSYALFFALVANDPDMFDRLLRWTENNLAEGALKAHLPAWLWGKNEKGEWTVLDSNSASDADMWIVWSLLEAGRLWKKPDYIRLGEQLLKRVAKEEVVKIPGLGFTLLPGKVGFNHAPAWRLNPSYLPPQVLQRVVRYEGPWPAMRAANQRLLLETAPKGFSPDWASWQQGKGWQFNEDDSRYGSYNAIRVYLWVGMMADNDPHKALLLKRFQPMADLTTRQGVPPEKVDVQSGIARGNGPVGFSAAMLPFLQDGNAREVQRQRVNDNFPQADAYYSFVLTLFGQGWDQKRFRFNSLGELLPGWGQVCAGSH
ncbi:Endoglucanase precursor [Cedecea davisae]|nr:cellulose synthase complex periplasmic endoglucanase BcsZ [Cedecea davisae]SUX37202.1 Endoglucanase precursor [Cedecea davisae]